MTPILQSITMSPSSAPAGSTVSFTVTLNQTAYSNQTVNISCSDSTAFTDLPSSVTVLAGNNTVAFSATLSPTADGNYTVTATQGNIHQMVTGRAIWGE